MNKDNSKSVYDLMQSVATHLAGRPVIVRFKKPINQNLTGTVLKDHTGNIYIDIKPGVHDEHKILKAFCIGCAYARYYYVGLETFNASESGSDHGKGKSSTPEAHKKAFVDGITERWCAHLRSHQSEESSNTLEDNLYLLLRWDDHKHPEGEESTSRHRRVRGTSMNLENASE